MKKNRYCVVRDRFAYLDDFAGEKGADKADVERVDPTSELILISTVAIKHCFTENS
jgi:hypothetical protein